MQPKDNNWSGSYDGQVGFSEIDISSTSNGQLKISGGVIDAAGESPVGSSFELSQIELQMVKPKDNMLVVRRIRSNMRVFADKIESRGNILSDCHLYIKKNGPFLFIRDNPACSYVRNEQAETREKERPFFPGLWVQVEYRQPKPRKDHALNMPLGR